MLKVKDLCYSETASKQGIDNTPQAYSVKQNLRMLCKVLNEAGIGKDRIISCYRSPGLNSKIGGAPHSTHMSGTAVDIACDSTFDCITTINYLNACAARFFANVDYFYMSRTHHKIHIDFVFTYFN